jgi:hypothetical protein
MQAGFEAFRLPVALLLISCAAFIGHNLDKVGDERFSKDAICSSLFRCSSRTDRLSFGLFFFDLPPQFYNLVLAADHAG